MKVLFDINHPAHVHFFRNPIQLLKDTGHEVIVTSRDKDVTLDLLEELGIPNLKLSVAKQGGFFSLLAELLQRVFALSRVVRANKPDVMASIGGTFIAHAGFLTRTQSLVFYDTENAKLQNLITYPLATRVIVPDCYSAWLPRSSERYRGYHELSYLHPSYFSPDESIAKVNGFDDLRDNFIVRVVSWQANHDIGEEGWTPELLLSVVEHLAQRGKVHLVAEGEVPAALTPYLYQGNTSELHHVMARCRLFVGESATMASECAVLGVPAIYAAHTSRGYIVEQQDRYGLVRDMPDFSENTLIETVGEMLQLSSQDYQRKRQVLLEECIDVAAYVVDRISIAAEKSL